jgi:pimeloyl-ACP methyl ester carboxylesterase
MPFLHVNGTNLHCHSQGKGDAIVFIHPPFIGSHVFTYLYNDLAQDYRTVMIDLRGHGHSDPGRSRLTLQLIVEDLKQALDQLEIDNAYLCSYSVGSFPLFAALLTHPDRFKGGITLSGTSRMKDGLYRPLMNAVSFTLRLQLKEAIVLPVAMANADSRLAFVNLHREAMMGAAQRWREYNAECLRYSFTDELRDIKQPMLLLCGENNKRFVHYAQKMHERLPRSELYVIRDAPHHILTKQPTATADAIRSWMAAGERHERAGRFDTRQPFNRELTEQSNLESGRT